MEEYAKTSPLVLRRHLSTLLFLAFITISFSVQAIPPQLFPEQNYQELEQLLQIMKESEGSPYPIGNAINVQLPNQHEPVEAYVVLYKLPQELHEKYKDQFVIPGFIKALAIRSQTEFNKDGSAKNFTPKNRTEIEDVRNHPFEIAYSSGSVDVPLSWGTYELETSLRIHYKIAEMSEAEAARHAGLILLAIHENWSGQVKRMPFVATLNIQLQCDDCKDTKKEGFNFGTRFIDILISPSMKRSYVMMYEKTGCWQTQQQYSSEEDYKKMIAHEFGHILGFKDLYTDVAYYDLAGNLISITNFTSLSIFSQLNLLSPFPHIFRFNLAPAEDNKNIMASSTLGHVSKKHLEAVVDVYNRNCSPFPNEEPWAPFLQHRR